MASRNWKPIYSHDFESIGDVVIQGDGELDVTGRLEVAASARGLWKSPQVGQNSGLVADASIASLPGSNGSAIVTGEVQLGPPGPLPSVVICPRGTSNRGAGVLTISNGGGVWVTEDVMLFADGVINLNGGMFKADRVDFFFGAGEFNFNGGSLHVKIFDSDLVHNGGTLSPGQTDGDAGDTLITGEYHMEDFTSRLQIEIGGMAAGTEYDFVNVDQDVFLTGFLDLELIEGF